MGVGSNSSVNRSLNDEKERGAGRQGQKGPAAEAIKEFEGEDVNKSVPGAFGKEGMANRGTANALGEGGGGGGGATTSDLQDVSPSTRPAKKQDH